MNITGVVLAIFALVVVAVIAYRAGYQRGQPNFYIRANRQRPSGTSCA